MLALGQLLELGVHILELLWMAIYGYKVQVDKILLRDGAGMVYLPWLLAQDAD